MHIGLIGLGKMGGNMRERLRRGGHTVVGYDRNAEVSDVGSLEELVDKLESPKVVWVMVPSGDPTRETVKTLGELLGEGDVVVDGGNSRWTDDFEHAKILAEEGVGYVDCGVSGGVWGLDNGYALMCGGDAEHVAKVQPAFDTLKPEGDFGFVHAGPVGAGHFSKMVHNGIEYGDDAGLRRGLRAAREGRGLRERHRGVPVLARGHRDPLLAARPPGRRAGRGRGAVADQRGTPTTPARAAGRSRRRSSTPCRCTRSPLRCSPASSRGRTSHRR